MSADPQNTSGVAVALREAALERLPDALYAAVVTGPGHDLEARIAGVADLRAALLEGRVPQAHALPWPASPIKEKIVGWLNESGLPRYCRETPDLTDAVMLSIIDVATQIGERSQRDIQAILDELLAIEDARRQTTSKSRTTSADMPSIGGGIGKRTGGVASGGEGVASGTGNAGEPSNGEVSESNSSGNTPSGGDDGAIGGSSAGNANSATASGMEGTPLSDDEFKELMEQAERMAAERAGSKLLKTLVDRWGERLLEWAAIEEVFGELGSLSGLGWGLGTSVLRHTGWQDAKRLADLLKKLPQIQDVVRQLGRMQSTEKPDETPILERLFGPVRRAPAELRDIDTPPVPHDTRGVERSGDIARMLPSEAILFMRPALRLLWHAKRAERALATYRVRGVQQERLIADETGSEARDADRPKKKQERGPIIVCLDTSGSMRGAPEIIAKAVTLEAVRIANAEKRDCFLYAFSGVTQVAEFDLSVNRGGVQALLEFLGVSFHGGTDVAAPVSRAIERIRTAKWSRADLMIVSDGEFPVPTDTLKAVTEARASLHLRVHGLLIGAYESTSMTALCNPLHRFASWQSLADAEPGKCVV